jgi:hypothetical protein
MRNTNAVEKECIILGIYGEPQGCEAENIRKAEFPSYFIEAGKHMYPEDIYLSGVNPDTSHFHLFMDLNTGNKYRKYRFVLPYLCCLDLGSLYVPEKWVAGIEFAQTGGLKESENPLEKVLFYGYSGIEIRPWLHSHVEEIVDHFKRLKSEWTNPGNSVSEVRYSFEWCFRGYQKNISLRLGQLLRFGGIELIVAIQIADGSSYVKLAGL